jgi:hypothetical protein
MKKIKGTIIALTALLGIAAAPLVPAAVHAAPADDISNGVQSIGGKSAGADDLNKGIKNVTNVLLFLLGAIAVIMIIIGGIRYATSNGDAGAIKGAKDTILYACIGLAVALLAYAIVNFVLTAFK